MRIENSELHFLEIPFRLSFSHGARAGRISSDSMVLRVSSGSHDGFGEAVVREYVSGSLGQGEDLRQEAARITSAFLAPLKRHDLTWLQAAAILAEVSCEPPSLPLLCAVESAVLACAVEEQGADIYSVLEREPLRTTVVYGGVLPFVPLETARALVAMCVKLKLTDLKVKVGRDPEYNEQTLGVCRQALGGDFDIRVDANSAWTTADVDEQMEICSRHGVRVIEQPFPVSEYPGQAARMAAKGFSIMADEGVLTTADIRALASSGSAQLLNLRLSKNGGLSRVLALAAEAEAWGLSYQLGCMVGETGILSCMGRLAASLLPKPLYIEGSYDEMLLEQNIVTPSFGFGAGGRAPISRGQGMGYRVEKERLSRFSLARLSV
jgi:L-alanine-DL-glutamate epimerase-like enolase superfamily enzyme